MRFHIVVVKVECLAKISIRNDYLAVGMMTPFSAEEESCWAHLILQFKYTAFGRNPSPSDVQFTILV